MRQNKRNFFKNGVAIFKRKPGLPIAYYPDIFIWSCLDQAVVMSKHWGYAGNACNYCGCI
jgi:hypothetical protein